MFGIGQGAVLVDHSVPFEGVDHGFQSRETPGQTCFPFGKGPSGGTNFDTMRTWTLPPVEDWSQVFGIGQGKVLVDHLVPFEGVDHGFQSMETPGRTHFPFGKGASGGTNFDMIRPCTHPSGRLVMGVWDWSRSSFD